MKLLFIGNSFSQDAGAHLYSLCKAGGADAEILNYIIGGCSFEMHAECIEGNLAKYMIQYNGKEYGNTLFSVLDYGLDYRDWDYISIQQVSGYSGLYETYHPYCDVLVNKIREKCPNAKIIIHNTWAYEHTSTHPGFPKYDCNTAKMAKAIKETYAKLKEDINAAAIIPVGEVIEILRAMPEFDVRVGGQSLHRDGYHLSYGYGRYAAAAVWYQALGLGDISENEFFPDVEGERNEKLYRIIRDTVAKTVKPIVK